MARDRKEFKKQIHQVDADCEELIRKHLDKGVHPLTICGALITNVSELCKNGSLDKQEFMVMRTAHGIGDWGIISAMPRLLKLKYPDCKIYIPSQDMLKNMFGITHTNAYNIFHNNPYIDKFSISFDDQLVDFIKLAESGLTQETELLIGPETALTEGIWEGQDNTYENTYSCLLYTSPSPRD